MATGRKQKENKTENDRWQKNLHLYLQSVIDDNGWGLQDLADELGIAYSTVARLKNPSNPTSPVLALADMKKMASLKGLTIDCFVSILLGNRNEEGESGGVFAEDLATKIGELSNITQVRLEEILRNKNNLEQLVGSFAQAVKSSPTRRALYSEVTELTDAQAKLFLQLMKEIKGINVQDSRS